MIKIEILCKTERDRDFVESRDQNRQWRFS